MAMVMILPVPGIVEYRDHHLVMICVLTKIEMSTIITVSGILERANDILSNILKNKKINLLRLQIKINVSLFTLFAAHLEQICK
jgi:hypothetical protein